MDLSWLTFSFFCQQSLVYGDCESFFEDALDRNISIPINFKNMHFLVTEIFKLSKTLFISIINIIFEKRNFTVYFMVNKAPKLGDMILIDWKT